MLNYILNDNTKNKLKTFATQFEIPQQELIKINAQIPGKLYKYCSLDRYSLDNLLNNELTGSSPEIFNDLYDATIHKNSSQFIRKEFDDLKKMTMKLGLESIDIPERDILNIENKAKESDRFYMRFMTRPFRVSSLSESNDSILMWSHYADMSKGICVEYDFRGKRDYQKIIFPIIYLDSPIDMSFLKENQDIDILSNSILLSTIIKSKVWSYEREWRCLFYMISSNELSERIHLINIPNPTAIYLGKNFITKWKKENNRDLFYLFCDYIKSKKIDLYIMNNKVLSYQLIFKKITLNELIKLDAYAVDKKFLE